MVASLQNQKRILLSLLSQNAYTIFTDRKANILLMLQKLQMHIFAEYIVRALSSGVPLDDMLCLTFTNKAVRCMRT